MPTASSSSVVSKDGVIALSWTKLVVANSSGDEPTSPCSRSSHGVSIIPRNKDGTIVTLIVYGGEHIARTPVDPNQACWALDLHLKDEGKQQLQWRRIGCTGGCETPPARVAHAQAVCYETKCLYIFGGRAGIQMNEAAMNDLWMLDCSGEIGTETWKRIDSSSETASTPEARSFHRMVCIDQSLYMFGGCGATSGRLNDLWCYDITTQTWKECGTSQFLRGRGGPNLIPLAQNTKLGVIAGFAGEETNDGHRYDLTKNSWEDDAMDTQKDNLGELRPRSVCISGSFPTLGKSIIFGGEVDPSQKGHEGAGGFANDIVLLDESTGRLLETIAAPTPTASTSESWPESRGWSDGDIYQSHLYMFGGLTGDDTNPKRLDDLWRLDISTSK